MIKNTTEVVEHERNKRSTQLSLEFSVRLSRALQILQYKSPWSFATILRCKIVLMYTLQCKLNFWTHHNTSQNAEAEYSKSDGSHTSVSRVQSFCSLFSKYCMLSIYKTNFWSGNFVKVLTQKIKKKGSWELGKRCGPCRPYLTLPSYVTLSYEEHDLPSQLPSYRSWSWGPVCRLPHVGEQTLPPSGDPEFGISFRPSSPMRQGIGSSYDRSSYQNRPILPSANPIRTRWAVNDNGRLRFVCIHL